MLIMQRTSISEKENVLMKKVLLLKKLLSERSACFEKVHVLNNYLFYSSLFSVASACAGKVFIFKKRQIRKSMCYQKVVITAFRKRTFPKHLEQLLISNTLPLHSIRCSEKKKIFAKTLLPQRDGYSYFNGIHIALKIVSSSTRSLLHNNCCSQKL